MSHTCLSATMGLDKDQRVEDSIVIFSPYIAEMVPTYHGWMKDPVLREQTCSEEMTFEEEQENQVSWMNDMDKITFILLDPTRPENPALGPLGKGGAMCGDINGFFNSDDPNDDLVAKDAISVEISVMVAEKESRGKGIAKRAVCLLEEHCLARLPIRKFVAKIGIDNSPSRSLFEGLGYSLVRVVEAFQEATYEKLVQTK